MTNGVVLFVERMGAALMNLSQQGQRALREDFKGALTRVAFGLHGRPVIPMPFTRWPS